MFKKHKVKPILDDVELVIIVCKPSYLSFGGPFLNDLLQSLLRGSRTNVGQKLGVV